MNATDTPADVGGRTVERTIEIDAPVDAVWAALTDVRELMNWFPEQARVEPGVGGSIWMSWDGHYEADSVIDRWEPGEHLRIRFPSGDEKALVTDYHLHSEGVLRDDLWNTHLASLQWMVAQPGFRPCWEPFSDLWLDEFADLIRSFLSTQSMPGPQQGAAADSA